MADSFASIVEAVVQRPGLQSAAIFLLNPETDSLELAAAAGVGGDALERLVVAVRNPAHPVARTVTDATASFDVAPVAPGGPKFRSHVPLIAPETGPARVVGVLAVAHERSLSSADRQFLIGLADQAADVATN